MGADDPRLIVALDQADIDATRALVKQLDPSLCRLKIGSVLYTAHGPWFVEELMMLGFDVFLDLKFHDIPQTVAGACREAAALGVWMLTIHAAGGQAMMEAAQQAVAETDRVTHIVAVTVLTSLDQGDLEAFGVKRSVADQALALAEGARAAGLSGVVCSAQEAALLRQQLGPDCLLVTPGIRLAQDDTQDQKRVVTPEQAIAAGADYLVLGRAITAADRPLDQLQQIHQSLVEV